MKHLLYSLLVMSSLASCSHRDPAPAPALTGDTWTLQSQLSVATPKDGSAPTTSAYPITEKVTMTFQSETRFRMEVSKPNGAGNQRFEGAYSYQGQTLSFPAISSWPTPFVVPRTVTVVQLSAHQLVTERYWDAVDVGDGYYVPTSYVTTDTYTR